MQPAVIKVNGLEELGRALLKFGDVMAEKHLQRATFNATKPIKEDAIARAPVRSGDLQEHIATFKRSTPSKLVANYAISVRKIPRKIRRIARRIRATGARFTIAHDVSYWWHVEFGTVHMAAHPFFRSAFESKKNDGIEAFRVTMADAIPSAAADSRT